MTKKEPGKIKKEALRLDWELTFGGKTKGNKHLWRVIQIAKFLTKSTKANIDLVEAGAWLHDAPLVTGSDYDLNVVKSFSTKLLRGFDLSETERAIILDCIVSHEDSKKPESIEAKIVHDADVLDKLGVLGLIRHNVKSTNMGLIDENVTLEQARKIVDHLEWRAEKLQLSEAKDLANLVSIKDSKDSHYLKALELIKLTIPLAEKGVRSELIAAKLKSRINKIWSDQLFAQINLKYLR